MSSNSEIESKGLGEVEASLKDLDIPAAACESVKQHYENLASLTENLRRLGMEEAQIDEHVIEIFKEYVRELASNIERIEASGAVDQLEPAS